MTNRDTNFLIYTGADGKVTVEVYIQDETVWLTQKRMAELFGVDVRTISEHLRNIFNSDELEESATIRKIRTVQKEGSREIARELDYYNLDAIIAVGYRVNSYHATRFRVWATGILREYIIKGFAMDDERLKQGKTLFGKDYFDELLERIREIRASERRFYQKITDIYALSSDYDKNSPITKDFFATVQNKMHWAITGQTAAEIIYNSADAHKIYMGLTNWKHAPDGKILKSDVAVAKNYLTKAEMEQLQRLVSAYLDVAESMALRQIPMTMQDWEGRLNRFIEATDRDVLQDAGKVTAEIAKAHAESEFQKYRVIQDRLYQSDFDRLLQEDEPAGDAE